MKLRLKNLNQVPYGGEWRINRPDLGMVGSGYLFDVLIDRLVAWRRANGFPIGLGFRDEVEARLCELYPAEAEYYDANLPRARKLTMADVIHGTKVLLALKASGKKLVSRDEANRRAAICANCQFNVTFPKPCSGLCPELKSIVEAIIGNERTAADADNKSCAVCGCFTASHIWLPLDILDKGLTPEMRAQFSAIQHCWKKT